MIDLYKLHFNLYELKTVKNSSLTKKIHYRQDVKCYFFQIFISKFFFKFKTFII